MCMKWYDYWQLASNWSNQMGNIMRKEIPRKILARHLWRGSMARLSCTWDYIDTLSANKSFRMPLQGGHIRSQHSLRWQVFINGFKRNKISTRSKDITNINETPLFFFFFFLVSVDLDFHEGNRFWNGALSLWCDQHIILLSVFFTILIYLIYLIPFHIFFRVCLMPCYQLLFKIFFV